MDSVQVRWYGDRGSRRAPLVWVHGGGFVHGDLDMPESDAVARAVAASGRAVVAVGYRLEPYPAPVDDVVEVFLAARAAAPGREVVLGGASAGACIALGAALRLRDAHQPPPAGLVLVYGTFHASLPAAGPQLRRRIVERWWWRQLHTRDVDSMNRTYAGVRGSEAYAFPGGHDLAGLPAVGLLDADRDRLRASGELLVQELQRHGVPHRHEVVEGTAHGFLNRPEHPGFARGIAAIVDWLEEQDGQRS